MNKRKFLEKIQSGSKNIRFEDMVSLVEGFGFRLDRISGSHHIFVHPDAKELVNLQKVRGKVKPYKIRQFLRPIERYRPTLRDDL